ncbi:hypothetical protein HOY80DRAFT_690238 [Tuber brumale]|nr:hypothetical protein HOY80DRAFT_690238 [Tuber brumale]
MNHRFPWISVSCVEHGPLTVLQQRETSRSPLSPVPQQIEFKPPAVVGGGETRVDPTHDPEGERTKLVSDPNCGCV